MKRPSFQFYPADWRRDAALQSCSVSARGLWVELMCVMHDCEPYGVLAVNGRAMSPAQLARLVGEQEKVIVRLLAELEDAGVCSRDEEGRLFSRRMVKDEGVREARAAGGHAGAEHGHKGGEHGKKGGRPRKAEAGSSGEEKTPLKPTLKTPLATIEEPPPSSSSSSSPSGNEGANAPLSPDEPADAAAKPEKSALPTCPHVELIDLYAKHLPMLPQPRAELWDGARAAALKARWAWTLTAKKRNGQRYATDRASAIAFFDRFFAYVATCPHLVGENDRRWTADMSWLCKADNFAKVLQGNYEAQEEAA